MGVAMSHRPQEKQPGVSKLSSPRDGIYRSKEKPKQDQRGCHRSREGRGGLSRGGEEEGHASLSIPSEQLSHWRQVAEGKNHRRKEASRLSLHSLLPCGSVVEESCSGDGMS